MSKDFFRTCNVLPFSDTHLAFWRGKGKVKDPRYMQNKKDSRISLLMSHIRREYASKKTKQFLNVPPLTTVNILL